MTTIKYYLYRITNTATSELYFGMTKNPSTRWSQHKCATINTYTLIHRKIQEYGAECFTFELLAAGDKQYIKDLEERAIIAFDSLEPKGYNGFVGMKKTVLSNLRSNQTKIANRAKQHVFPPKPGKVQLRRALKNEHDSKQHLYPCLTRRQRQNVLAGQKPCKQRTTKIPACKR